MKRKKRKNDKVWIKLSNPKLTNYGLAEELSVESGVKIRARGNCRGKEMPRGCFWKADSCQIVGYRHSDPYLVVYGCYKKLVEAAQVFGRRDD